jgi:hypothetical protein
VPATASSIPSGGTSRQPPRGRLDVQHAPTAASDQQAQIAKVYIARFLEGTLHNELGYLPLFRDHRSAPDLRISAKPNAHFRLMPITRFGVKPNSDFDAERVGTG